VRDKSKLVEIAEQVIDLYNKGVVRYGIDKAFKTDKKEYGKEIEAANGKKNLRRCHNALRHLHS
jgi:hypothetical protein